MVAKLVERPPGLYLCVRKRSVRSSSRPADSKKIPFSKELTDNYCALGLLFESITCNNNNNNKQVDCSFGAIDKDLSHDASGTDKLNDSGVCRINVCSQASPVAPVDFKC